MSETSDDSALQIDTDREWLRREWRVERVGWWIWALVLVGAVGGAFGRGPLANDERDVARAPGVLPARLEYERLVRHGATTELILTLPAAGTGTSTALDTVRFSLDEAFLRRVDRFDVSPAPVDCRTGAGRLDCAVVRSRDSHPGEIRIAYEADFLWLRSITVAVDDGPPTRVRQFVYP